MGVSSRDYMRADPHAAPRVPRNRDPRNGSKPQEPSGLFVVEAFHPSVPGSVLRVAAHDHDAAGLLAKAEAAGFTDVATWEL